MAKDASQHQLKRPIALIGLMGCGKSTVGAALSSLIRAPFRDADSEIERAAGRTIPEIFETLGETAFREGERRVIARLLSEEPMVIATGGGAFMAAETRDAITRAGAAIWLDADLDTLVERTARRRTRPLLNKGDPRKILSDLIEARYPVYAKAPIRITSSRAGTAEDVAQMALAAIHRYDAAQPTEHQILEPLP